MFNFFKKPSCNHERITPDVSAAYCTDCGEYIENHWFITRCGCCGLKQKTILVKHKISADAKYCRNCGSCSFFTEKLKSINFVDVNYAIVIKQVVENKKPSFTQSWVEANDNTPVKLLAGT